MQAEVARLGELALRSVGTGAVAAGVVEASAPSSASTR